MNLKVLVCAGATAGHIEPALNVAKELQSCGVTCEFVGTVRGLDRKLVPAEGFRLHLIKPVAMPRKISPDIVIFPFRFLVAVLQALSILRRFKPGAIMGFGSFVAMPMYVAAWLQRIPLFIHEANAKPGIANRIGAKFAVACFQSVENSIPGAKTLGTPLRAIYNDFQRTELRALALKEFGLSAERRTLLVFGGSQGARHINEVLNEISGRLTDSSLQILHIVGGKNQDQIQTHPHHHYCEYVSDMSLAYAAADVAVCRSGAMTVAEISATSTPAIFIPFPTGNGEQEKNALPLVEHGSARLLLEANLTPQSLFEEISYVVNNLISMQKSTMKPRNATKEIADEILGTVSV